MSSLKIPRVIVFDLDNCCWNPEMYQMYHGPPFKYNGDENVCVAKDGEEVHLCGNVAQVWGAIRNKGKVTLGEFITTTTGKQAESLGHGFSQVKDIVFDPSRTKIAIASCCDEPSWANEILGKFRLVEVPSAGGKWSYGETMAKAVSYKYIHYGGKRQHHQEIKQSSGADYSDMIFFDDQPGHIRDVGGLGVTAVQTPGGDGVTWERFVEALVRFQKS